MNEVTEGCGGREGGASQVRVGSKSVVSVNIPKPSQFSLYFCLRSLPFLMLLAGQTERCCGAAHCSLTLLSPFLRAHAFIVLPEAAKEGEGARLTPSLESCFWQMFVYLFKFLHSTKKCSVSWAGWESGVAYRMKQGRLLAQGAAWKNEGEEVLNKLLSQNPAQQ